MGKFEKGHPKVGGRRPGSPNRLSPKRVLPLLERALERGVDPWEELLSICKHEDDTLRLAAVKEACSYLYAKKKSIELQYDPELAKEAEAIALLPEAEQIRLMELEIKRLKGK